MSGNVLQHLRWMLHRCNCCHARNRSVGYWPTKGHQWLCGECVFGPCDFDCNGIPWRKRYPDD